MSNVTTGDLAWISRAAGQPHLLRRIVSVGRRYMGEPFFDTLGRPAVFDDHDPIETLGWYITLPRGEYFRIDLRAAGFDGAIGVAYYRTIPWADSALRRIAGPSIEVEGFTAIEVFPDALPAL